MSETCPQAGYEKPSAIQMMAIPLGLAVKDVIGRRCEQRLFTPLAVNRLAVKDVIGVAKTGPIRPQYSNPSP